jgi:hypothetical protein
MAVRVQIIKLGMHSNLDIPIELLFLKMMKSQVALGLWCGELQMKFQGIGDA